MNCSVLGPLQLIQVNVREAPIQAVSIVVQERVQQQQLCDNGPDMQGKTLPSNLEA